MFLFLNIDFPHGKVDPFNVVILQQPLGSYGSFHSLV